MKIPEHIKNSKRSIIISSVATAGFMGSWYLVYYSTNATTNTFGATVIALVVAVLVQVVLTLALHKILVSKKDS